MKQVSAFKILQSPVVPIRKNIFFCRYCLETMSRQAPTIFSCYIKIVYDSKADYRRAIQKHVQHSHTINTERSVWVVRSMSKKRLLMSTGYECPCMVQSGQLMSGRLRSPPTQSTEFLCLDVRSSMVLHMSSIYCRSLFGGRYIAAIMMCLLLLRCILVAVIYNCVGVAIGSWMMSDLMDSSTPPPIPILSVFS